MLIIIKKVLPILVILAGISFAPGQTAVPLQLVVEELAIAPFKSHVSIPANFPVEGKLYYFGAVVGPDIYPMRNTDQSWSFDPATRIWSLLPLRLPYELRSSSATTAGYIDGHFYLPPCFATGDYGGWGSHNRIIDFDLANASSRETAAAFPGSPVWGLSSIVANGKIYHFGGWSGYPRSQIMEYDPSGDTLTPVAQMSVASHEVVSTLGADGWIYYWGYFHPGRQIERFHPVTHEVQRMASILPTFPFVSLARWHFSQEGAIYFFLGGGGYSASSPIYRFDYLNDRLESTGIVPPDSIVNQQVVMDPQDPHVIYGFKSNGDTWDNLTLCRLTLGPSNLPPVAHICPLPDQLVGPGCSVSVNLDGTGSSDPDNDPLTYEWMWTGTSSGTAEGPAPTVTLGKGAYTITLTVDDGRGGTSSDSAVVQVLDKAPPVFNLAAANPSVLWPVNHKMIPVKITAAVTDNCDPAPVVEILSVTSNEPINGPGDGNTSPDWQKTGPLSLNLRAERSGTGTGRIYSIVVQAMDSSGNKATTTVNVLVPHDQGGK